MQLDSPLYTLGPYSAPLWQANALDSSGCAWICTSEDGWSASPPARPSQQAKTIGDGAWAGKGFYDGRLVTLEGTCVAPDQVSMLWAKEAVKSAIDPGDLVALQVDELHLSRTAQVRLYDKVEITDQGSVAFKWQMGLLAPDPRRYSASPQSGSCQLPGAGTETGRTYPRGYPMSYGGGSGAGAASEVVIAQQGNYKLTPAVITFRGPLFNPAVLHDVSGSSLTLLMSLSFTDFVTIDLLAQSALLNGVTPVNSALTQSSAWFMLARGDNVLSFRGTAGVNGDGSPGTPTMTVTAASAWA